MEESQSKEKEQFSKFFIKSNINQLDEILKHINNFENQIKILLDFLNKYSEYENNLLNSINTFKGWLDSLFKSNNQKEIEESKKKLFKEFSKSFNEYQEKNQNMIDILKELDKIKNNIYSEKEKFSFTINFDSNNYIDKSPSFNQNFHNDEKVDEKSNENASLNEAQIEYLICRACRKKAEFMYKNNYYCRNCTNYLKNNSVDLNQIDIIPLNKYNSAKLYEFINSVSICIKLILLKSDYLIRLGNIETIESKQNNKIMHFSRSKDINYPFIKDHDNINYINFLKDMEKTLNNECNFNNFKQESFAISNLNEYLLKRLKILFYDEERNKIDETFNNIKNMYCSDEHDDIIFYINQFETDGYYNKYISPKQFYHYYNIKIKKEQENIKNNINLNNKSIIKNESKKNSRKKAFSRTIFLFD